MSDAYRIGMVGLGTMGQNLLLNMAEHGFSCVGYDLDVAKRAELRRAASGLPIATAESFEDLVRKLWRPRTVVVLVPAGKAVDSVIESVRPHLEAGDILIDSGNSYFKDTERRQAELDKQGVGLLGMGISGGGEGARRGPSLMVGGPRSAYDSVREIVEAVSAKVEGTPCGAYVGSGSAGHYVKMVHNGIEYAIMRLIGETYDLMKRSLRLDNDQLAEVYERWNGGPCSGYLMEITAKIFMKPDDRTGERLIDMILGHAQASGTGMWTSENAFELHVPVPTIDMAVAMRDLSGRQAKTGEEGQRLGGPDIHYQGGVLELVERMEAGLHAAMGISYAQGLTLLAQASRQYSYGLDLEQIATIWRGGCIIRARMLEMIRRAYARNPGLANLLDDPEFAAEMADEQGDLRAVVHAAVETGISMPGFMTCLSYLDAYRSPWSPANLIQAQRDYFGAHRYERIDAVGAFHTQWTNEP